MPENAVIFGVNKIDLWHHFLLAFISKISSIPFNLFKLRFLFSVNFEWTNWLQSIKNRQGNRLEIERQMAQTLAVSASIKKNRIKKVLMDYLFAFKECTRGARGAIAVNYSIYRNTFNK